MIKINNYSNAPLDCKTMQKLTVKTAIECAEETDKIKQSLKKNLPDINRSIVNTLIVLNMNSEMRLDYSVIITL